MRAGKIIRYIGIIITLVLGISIMKVRSSKYIVTYHIINLKVYKSSKQESTNVSKGNLKGSYLDSNL